MEKTHDGRRFVTHATLFQESQFILIGPELNIQLWLSS